MFILTSNKHDKYRESFLHICIRSNIAKPNTRQRRARKVKSSDVSRPEAEKIYY